MYLPDRNLPPPPPYVPATETNIYPHYPPQKQVDGYPERPGQPECSYFLKTGDCKFKSNCKYHHPKKRASVSPPCALSDKGLPLRPVSSHFIACLSFLYTKFKPMISFLVDPQKFHSKSRIRTRARITVATEYANTDRAVSMTTRYNQIHLHLE